MSNFIQTTNGDLVNKDHIIKVIVGYHTSKEIDLDGTYEGTKQAFTWTAHLVDGTTIIIEETPLTYHIDKHLKNCKNRINSLFLSLPVEKS